LRCEALPEQIVVVEAGHFRHIEESTVPEDEEALNRDHQKQKKKQWLLQLARDV
jgi:hypothetical protein